MPSMEELKLSQNEATHGPTIMGAFITANLPPEWGMAIARQESKFNAAAVNKTGGDLARGGAFGLMQMTLMTARALGFAGFPEDLLEPKTNTFYAAKLCAQLVKQFKSQQLKDVAAGYNSGRDFAHAPSSTATIYVPNVLDYAKQYQKMARAWFNSQPCVCRSSAFSTMTIGEASRPGAAKV